MNIQIFGKTKCFDTKKAERYFKERGIKYQYVDLGKKALGARELDSIARAVGLENLIDTESKLYQGSVLRYTAGDEQKKQKLIEDMRLVRTPIVRNGSKATVGYCPDVWDQWKD